MARTREGPSASLQGAATAHGHCGPWVWMKGMGSVVKPPRFGAGHPLILQCTDVGCAPWGEALGRALGRVGCSLQRMAKAEDRASQ